MFSKELENLIQATLEDGRLEDNEKAALVRRAEREGVDLAELEIYINSLLQKRARELESQESAKRKKYEKEKKEAIGPVCPKCGAQVTPLTLKCECGYEFTNQKQVSSVQVLLEKIEKIQLGNREKEEKNQIIIDTIKMFPVPNAKEDIIEFLALAVANSKQKGGLWGTNSGRIKICCIIVAIGFIFGFLLETGFGMGEAILSGIFFAGVIFIGLLLGYMILFPLFDTVFNDIIRENKVAKAWRSKFDQIIVKARSLRGDEDFKKQLDYYEEIINRK